MKRKFSTKESVALLILAIISFSLFPPRGNTSPTPSTGCTSAQCHTGITKHPAEKECAFCHIQTTQEHPTKGAQTFTTAEQKCLGCHETVTDYDYLHPPVAASDCYACHTPHGSAQKFYIKGEKGVICYSCHTPVAGKNDTFLHSDVKNGECKGCHAHHGSFFPNLMRAEYSTSFFNDYADQHYELCFKCHKIDLLLHPKTSYNTLFRDGKINLHYLHVKRETKGRACKFCHDIHASENSKLVAKSVLFGGWQMPINYTPTENGGSCVPGCHKPESYDRTK